MSATIAFVGSVRMECWVRTPKLPRAGEFVGGAAVVEHPGGKGAIQAVQASRLGAKAVLVGCLGDDSRGRLVRRALSAETVDLEGLRVVEGGTTGVAFFLLPPTGPPAVLVAPGEKTLLTVEDIDRVASELAEARVLAMTSEAAPDVLLRAAKLAQQANATVVLNASPAKSTTLEVLAATQILILREREGHALLGKAADDCSASGLARRLASKGPEQVVVLLDAGGALHFDGEECVPFDPPARLAQIDPLGVEGAFVGAFSVRLGEGGRFRDAVEWGVAAAALVGSRKGGMDVLPTREAVEGALARAPAG
ncbi:MAG: PfkB family carbohydrate kinase [Planctomycetota bacterium]